MPIEVRFRALTSKKKFIRTESLTRDILKEYDKMEDELMRKAQYYPPYDSDYVRTYTLYGGWKSSISNTWSGLTLKLWNNVRYSIWVQGEEQKPLFKWIGWYKIADEVGFMRKDFRKRIQAIIKKNLET